MEATLPLVAICFKGGTPPSPPRQRCLSLPNKAATAKALNEKTQFLDQMMMNLDPSSSDYKKYKTQRDLVIQQFLQDQAMLAGKSAPATAIKGTVERIG